MGKGEVKSNLESVANHDGGGQSRQAIYAPDVSHGRLDCPALD